MTTTAERYRNYRGTALFSMVFRPFFLFSAWAALAVPLWVAAYLGWLPHFTRDWHVHEMQFGYLSGVIAGFLLTAVPNWTGRLPVTGAPLAALFALWLAGRIAMLLSPANNAAASVIDSLFLFALAAIIAREVLAGRNIRNLPVCVLVSILGVANVLSHLGPYDAGLARLGERIGLAVVAMLVTLIGGRIVPSFTRNWMAKRKLAPEPASPGPFDIATLATTGAALLLWLIWPMAWPAGGALMLAGVLNLIRLARWRGWTTSAEALVLVLHAGYLWLGVAITLIGTSILAADIVPATAGVHALTAGAFGVMTLAVMTRASLGHTGRPLAATPAISAIYLLVNIGAAIRTAAPFFPDQYATWLAVAAAFWSGSFVLFALVYAPLLLLPRRTA
jgi:uncharacterized protein involved in response to NO